jgi:uncharacterized protein YcfJ
MEAIRTASRIHPVVAAAAVSVIIVSLTGAAAITGLLPTSRGAQDSQLSAVPPAQAYIAPTAAAPLAAPMPGQMLVPANAPVQLATAYAQPAYAQQAYVQPAPAPVAKPQVIREVVIKEVVKEKPVHHYHTVTRQVARNDAPTYYQQPAPRQAQPNYVGIGTGALIGGILGNQVGSGNGRKLATVAGIIGGGMLGNEVANRNR